MKTWNVTLQEYYIAKTGYNNYPKLPNAVIQVFANNISDAGNRAKAIAQFQRPVPEGALFGVTILSVKEFNACAVNPIQAKYQ